MINVSVICLLVITIAVILFFSYDCLDFFKVENYTPSVVRYLPCNENNNTCKFPNTNGKLNKPCNENVNTFQYGNRKVLNPDEYMIMVNKLLNDLSDNNINVSNIPTKLLKDIDYNGDQELIINFINNKIGNLVNTKSYLQNNGAWKYEYFFVSSPTIYYFEVNNENKLFQNLPKKFNLFKITYVLGNPLRSSYTSCLAFITNINNKLELQFTTTVNDFEKQQKDNLNVIPREALEFSFIDTIANKDFDQFGNTTNYSGLNYISEFREGTQIDIKADIPQEFKENNFNPQHLPPLFGNGICKYPPYYKTESGNTYIFNSPPLYS